MMQLIPALCARQETALRVAIIVAHPDDETIGAGGSLRLLSDLTLVLASNGTPDNLSYAHRNGFADNRQYADARRAELCRALVTGETNPAIIEFGFGDQALSDHLAALIQHILWLVEGKILDVIITQPYEGGHPDHDAVAFAVRTARRQRSARGQPFPDVVEMTSYHASPEGAFIPQAFLPGTQPVCVAALSDADQKRKRDMFTCFATQTRALKIFRTETELFREAPDYDFSEPPHAGMLHYERRNWGLTGAQWRDLARAVQ